MTLCPFCDQDAVWHCRLTSSPDCRFSMCFECDAVWLVDQEISDQHGTTFDQYMESLGRVPDWKDVERLEVVMAPDAGMQPAIRQLLTLGPFPSDDDAEVDQLELIDALIKQINSPISDNEALALMKLFGPDDLYGLAWSLLHLIETAPNWPPRDVLDAIEAGSNEWIDRLKERVAFSDAFDPPK